MSKKGESPWKYLEKQHTFELREIRTESFKLHFLLPNMQIEIALPGSALNRFLPLVVVKSFGPQKVQCVKAYDGHWAFEDRKHIELLREQMEQPCHENPT